MLSCNDSLFCTVDTCVPGTDGANATCSHSLTCANCDEANQVCPVCGNSVIEAGEECDDGNTAGGDGCSSTCTIEPGWICGSSSCQKDCNGNGIADSLDLSSGSSTDTNANGIPDECDGCVNDARYWDIIEGSRGSMGFSYSSFALRDACLAHAAVLAAQCSAADCSPLSSFLTGQFCLDLAGYHAASFLTSSAANTQCGKAQPEIFAFILNSIVGSQDKLDVYSRASSEVPTTLLNQLATLAASNIALVDAKTCAAQSLSQSLINLGSALATYNTGKAGIPACDAKPATCSRTTFSNDANCTGTRLVKLEGSCNPLPNTAQYYSAVCQSNAAVLIVYDRDTCTGPNDRYRFGISACSNAATAISSYANIDCISCPGK